VPGARVGLIDGTRLIARAGGPFLILAAVLLISKQTLQEPTRSLVQLGQVLHCAQQTTTGAGAAYRVLGNLLPVSPFFPLRRYLLSL